MLSLEVVRPGDSLSMVLIATPYWQGASWRASWQAVTVPDKRCRIHLEVVLVRRWASGVLGIWMGEGLGEGEVSLQAT